MDNFFRLRHQSSTCRADLFYRTSYTTKIFITILLQLLKNELRSENGSEVFHILGPPFKPHHKIRCVRKKKHVLYCVYNKRVYLASTGH